MRIYAMEIVEIEEAAHELLDSGAMVTLISSAPPELRESSVIVEPEPLQSSIEADDILKINGDEHVILAIGDIANKNVAELDHAVWIFDGKNEVETRGEVHLEQTEIPALSTGIRHTIERRF